MIFVGVDWAEAHHDVCVLNEAGEILARKRIPDSLSGIRALHELLGGQQLAIDTKTGQVIRLSEADTDQSLLISASESCLMESGLSRVPLRGFACLSEARFDPRLPG